MSTVFEYRNIIKDARAKIAELEEKIVKLRKKQTRVDNKYGSCKSFTELSANLQKSIQFDKAIAKIKTEIDETDNLVYRTDKLLIAAYNVSDDWHPVGW